MTRQKGLAALSILLAVLAWPQFTSAQVSFASNEVREMTYADDVAPIFRENCVTCHHPGTAAPMALETYEQVRRYATRIRQAVETRAMPPGWYLDRTVGIQEFKNDPTLTDEQIATITAWVDQGTPMGDPSKIQPPQAWRPAHEYWQLEEELNYGPPDLIVNAPTYLVPAASGDQWFEPDVALSSILDRPLIGERWIRAIETRPGDQQSAYVFHHVNVGLRPAATENTSGGDGGLTDAAVGKRFDLYPNDSGKLIRADDMMTFSLHLYPIGEEVEAKVQLGIWLWPEGETPKYATRDETSFNSGESASIGLPRYTDMLIPPNGYQELRAYFVLRENARIHSIRGHMHLRGGYQMMEAIYPDGRREVINKINWNHLWHTTHVYEDSAQPLLPKGTVIVSSSLMDNTSDNPSNPDVDQWVVYGRRSVSEMAHIRFGMTYIPDEDFQEMLEARERAQARPVPIASR